MPNIQVPADREQEIYEAHLLWQQQLPQHEGQLAAPILT
jgi:hypothetical protein